MDKKEYKISFLNIDDDILLTFGYIKYDKYKHENNKPRIIYETLEYQEKKLGPNNDKIKKE